MAQVLARQNQVLYLDYQFTWKDCLQNLLRDDPALSIGRVLGFKKRLRAVGPTEHPVLLLSPPPVLPINWLSPGPLYDFLQKINTAWVNWTLKRYLRRLDMRKDLIHINAFNPDYGRFTLPNLRAALHLYYCYDKIEAAQWAARHGAHAEAIFLAQVDGAVFSSKGLLRAKGGVSPSSQLIQNGVNFDLFHQAYLSEATAKTVIYIGAIDFRIDYTLMKEVIASLSDYDFHFVGPVKEPAAAQQLADFPQVRFTGSVGVEELPAVLKGCAAGIIPFEENDFTKGIYPLKVNEYLAAGLPVITTEFGDMADFKPIMPVVRNAQAFTKALQEEVANDSVEKREQRVAFARDNAWWARAEALSDYIMKLEASKPGHG